MMSGQLAPSTLSQTPHHPRPVKDTVSLVPRLRQYNTVSEWETPKHNLNGDGRPTKMS